MQNLIFEQSVRAGLVSLVYTFGWGKNRKLTSKAVTYNLPNKIYDMVTRPKKDNTILDTNRFLLRSKWG